LVRNTLTFHYARTTRLIGMALSTRGRDLHHWLFEPTQRVIGKVMLRKAFKLEGPVTSDDADQVLKEVFAVQDAFSDFAAEFIERCAR
jgi:hypothetical protein